MACSPSITLTFGLVLLAGTASELDQGDLQLQVPLEAGTQASAQPEAYRPHTLDVASAHALLDDGASLRLPEVWLVTFPFCVPCGSCLMLCMCSHALFSLPVRTLVSQIQMYVSLEDVGLPAVVP